MKTTTLLLLIITLLAAPLRAELPDPLALEPNLDESQVLFERMATTMIIEAEESGRRSLAGEPPWGRVDPLKVGPLRRTAKVRTVEALQKFDTDNPPQDTLWWNYPIYATIGLPRDLFDGFFGGASYVPFFNLLFAGGYEISGAQIIVRHRQDRHVWPGRPNANGHGWIKAPNGWGFFPHKNQTTFRRIDQTQLESWKTYNASVNARLKKTNEEIELQNMRVNETRSEHLETTTRHFRANNFPVAAQRLLVYTQADTSNRQAKAMLAVSLIALLPETPYYHWTHERIGHMLSASSALTLSYIDGELRKLREQKIAPRETAFYLTWANMRMGYPERAYPEIDAVLKKNPKDRLKAQLAFEAALATGKTDWITAAMKTLVNAIGKDTPTLLHAKGRNAYALKDYDGAIAIYRELTREAPANARYHYLLGLSHVAKGRLTKNLDRTAATNALSRAIRHAESPTEKIQYEKALRATKLLDVQ